jgi:hypothetical protein
MIGWMKNSINFLLVRPPMILKGLIYYANNPKKYSFSISHGFGKPIFALVGIHHFGSW